MNNLQKIASAISGYEHNNSAGSSAQCDYYYDECKSKEEKIAQIIVMGENGIGVNICDEIYISAEEAEKIMNFLDADFDGTNAQWHAFENLK